VSGNMKAILAVLGSSMAIFWPGALTFGFPGVMAPTWQEMFHVGRGATGVTIFFMLAAVGVFMFLVGRWQERYGTRKMITLGVILTSFASVAVAYASSIYAVYAWAFLNGLASSFVYIPTLTLVQRWYPEKKGFVSGIVSMVFGLSAAIMSPLFGKMLVTLGYVSMNLYIAVLTLMIGLAGAYFARAPDSSEKPASNSAVTNRYSGKKPQSSGGLQGSPERSLTVQECLHTRSFWFLWITWTLAGAAGVSMTILSTGYGLSRGFSMESAILLLTSFNLTNGMSRLISGYFSDKIGRNHIMSMAFMAASLAYFTLPWTDSLVACAFLAAVVGFSFGTLFSVSAPLVADCFGIEHFGAVFGLTFAAYGFIAGPIGPTLSGYLLDVTGDNFFLVFVYLGIFCILSGFCIRFVRRPNRS
jgi:MFS transporter, OFA family, oxalate/formate antiporter